MSNQLQSSQNLGKLLIAVFSLILVLAGILGVQKYSNTPSVAGVSSVQKPLKGIIVPHHDFANELIQISLQKIAANQNPSYILLIGPNHFHEQSPTITTSPKLLDYNLNSDFINELTNTFPSVEINNEVLENEHSMTTPIKYVEAQFPNAQITPLIFSAVYNPNDLAKKLDFIIKNLPKNTLVIASVDFAHETLLDEALANNKESIEAIASFDYEKILDFTDKYIDSPLTIYSFLKIMEANSATSWETWDSSHGALIIDDPQLQGTSYVTGGFR